MFLSARMKKIELLTLVSDEPKVTEALGEMGVLHLTAAPVEAGAVPVAGPELHEAEAHLEALVARADALCKALTVDTRPQPELVPHASLQEVELSLNEIETDVNGALAERNKLAAARTQVEKLLHDASVLRGIDAPIEQLEDLSFLHFAFGTLAPDQAAAAGQELGDRAVVLPYKTPYGEQKVVAVASKKGRWALESALEKHGFRREHIPADQRGLPSHIADLAEHRFEEILAQTKAVNESVRTATERHGQRLRAIRRRLQTEHRILQARQKYSHTWATMLISGWLPAERLVQLSEKVLELTNHRAIIEVRDPAAAEEQPPTLMKNHPLIRPFEMLVASYSLPHYNEIQPTLFIAVLFVLMFGVMFGDIGHSGLLLITGLILWIKGKNKMHDAGVILTFSAISGVIFGLIYGSVFGFQLGGEEGPFFRPLENAERMLMITVLFGVAVISLGILLNIINRLLRREYAELWLSRFGVAGGIFYWGSLAVAARGLTTGNVSWLAATLLIVAPLLVIFLRKPATLLVHHLRGQREQNPEGTVLVLIESAAEAFETVLGFVANTLSFARIGAFALAHGGLCLAVFEMTRVVKDVPGRPVWSALIFLLGTLLIVCLEGFIVAIQSLRLEYYEFFGKFFRGEGRRYEPFDLTRNGNTGT